MPMQNIQRRKTEIVKIKNVSIGYNYPIRIQSMTNTHTADVDETVFQILELEQAGSELVRITVNDAEAMKAVPIITSQLKEKNLPRLSINC